MSFLAAGLAKQLQCPVCLGEYRDPKLLRCYHSYCRRCVRDLLRRSTTANIVRCPQCRTEMEIPGGDVRSLKSNFIINNLLDLMADDRSNSQVTPTIKCERCGLYYTQVSTCVQCSIILCANCVEFHSQEFASQAHTIRQQEQYEPVEDVSAEKDPKTCAEHFLPLQLFCQSCEAFFCRECMQTLHWNHDCVVVKEAVKPVRSAMDWLLVKCKVKIPAITESLRRVDASKDLVDVGAEDMLSHIDKIIERKVFELNQRRILLRESVSQTRQRKLKSLHAQSEELSMIQASLASGVEFTEQALEEGNENELFSMREQLLVRLEELSGVEVRNEPCEWWNIAVEETPESEAIMDKLLKIVTFESDTDMEMSTIRMTGAEEGAIYRTFVNQPYTFIITLKDKEGEHVRCGGQRVRVAIRTPDRPCNEALSILGNGKLRRGRIDNGVREGEIVGSGFSVEVEDKSNGTHSFSFTPSEEGDHLIQVVINGMPLSGNLVWQVSGALGFGDPTLLGLNFTPLQSSNIVSHDWYNIGGKYAWQITRIPPEEGDTNRREPGEDSSRIPSIEVGIKSDSTKEKWGWKDGWRVIGKSSDGTGHGEMVRSTIKEWSEGDTLVFYHDIDAGRFAICSRLTGAQEIFRRCPGTSARPYIDPPTYDYFAVDRAMERVIFSRPNKK